ncbi:MAG: ATP-binding protein, partial [Pedobacter sp.]
MTISFGTPDKRGKDTTRKQTLFLGQNGTGKSSLLRAIALLTAGSSALGELLGQPDDWIRNKTDQCELEAVLVNKQGEQRSIRLTIQRDSSLKDVIKKNEDSITLLEDALGHAERNYFVVGYGASRRLNTGENAWFSQRGAYQNERSNNVATLFRNDAELNPLTAWAIDLDYQSNTPTEGLVVIREALEGLLPGIQFHSIDKSKKQLLFESADGIVPLHLLSDGYQNMTAWIGDLLYRISSSFRDYK